ncbi:MAG: acetylglutamate kinase [Salinivirgaceae bacterium]
MLKEKLTLIKAGGKILDSESELDKLLHLVSHIPGKKVLVHGGGVFIDDLCEKLNIPTQMVNGRRITSPENMDVVLMACAGKLNKQLVAGLNKRETLSVGLCGGDLNLIASRKRSPEPIDFGMVGDIVKVNTHWLKLFLSNGVVPVISSITQSDSFELLNTNADAIAAYVAVALSIDFDVELFFYFDKAGVLSDSNDANSLLLVLDTKHFEAMLASKAIHTGMLPKLQNGFFALRNGVKMVKLGNSILNGTYLVD